jgi:hypothetical protein
MAYETISIIDPVGGVGYALDPQTRTAHKYTLPPPAIAQDGLSMSRDIVSQIRYSNGSKFKTVVSSLGKQLGLNIVYDDSIKESTLVGSIELENVTLAKALEIILGTYKCSFKQVDDHTIRISAENPADSPGAETFESFYANVARSLRTAPRLTQFDSSESLGKRMIEGVEAEGTRITQTIQAGAMGNERPIEVLHELWYSQELLMDVMTKWIDPRLGESTQRLTNLKRGEPDASLFQPPSDYTIR